MADMLTPPAFTDTLKGLLGSKKFIVALSAGLVVKFGASLGLTTDQVQHIFFLALSYIGGQAIADAGSTYAKVAASIPDAPDAPAPQAPAK